MIRALLSLFGICGHRNIGWPRTHGTATTVQCFDCCKTVPYSLLEMKTTKDAKTSATVAVEA